MLLSVKGLLTDEHLPGYFQWMVYWTNHWTGGCVVWQPCCRSCSGIRCSSDELTAGFWCCTKSKMVLSPYPLQLTLNQFPSAPEGLKWDVQIQCNTGTYSQTVFPSAIRLWNTLPIDICQLSADSFKTHLNSLHCFWTQDYFLHLSSALHCFYPKLLFIVCHTAFSIHICLFTRGAILLEIESAPLSEDDDELGHV